ncbi:MAG: hypothetical protein GX496_04900 [Firmicutes bacterium]|nr:hypothetical protein [Bacillota bacterium]
MAHLTTLELEDLRHIIGEQKLAVEKLNAYSQACRDPELKQRVEQIARQASDNVQRLMTFLG